MKLRFHVLPMLAALGLAAASTVPAVAQYTLDVHDSVKVLRGEQLVDLKVTITNTDLGEINVRAVRFMNDLPEGTLWYSALCFGEMCYPPEVDTPPAARIASGGTADFKLTVGTETLRAGIDTIRVGVRFDAGPLSNRIEQEFLVIAEGGTSGAPDERTITVKAVAWPNPSAGATSIRLDDAAGLASLRFFDALGNQVRSFDNVPVDAGTVSVDLAGLPDGVYFFAAQSDRSRQNGSVTVSKGE